MHQIVAPGEGEAAVAVSAVHPAPLFGVAVEKHDEPGHPGLAPQVNYMPSGDPPLEAVGGGTDTYLVALARPLGQEPTADLAVNLNSADGQLTATDAALASTASWLDLWWDSDTDDDEDDSEDRRRNKIDARRRLHMMTRQR